MEDDVLLVKQARSDWKEEEKGHLFLLFQFDLFFRFCGKQEVQIWVVRTFIHAVRTAFKE